MSRVASLVMLAAVLLAAAPASAQNTYDSMKEQAHQSVTWEYRVTGYTAADFEAMDGAAKLKTAWDVIIWKEVPSGYDRQSVKVLDIVAVDDPEGDDPEFIVSMVYLDNSTPVMDKMTNKAVMKMGNADAEDSLHSAFLRELAIAGLDKVTAVQSMNVKRLAPPPPPPTPFEPPNPPLFPPPPPDGLIDKAKDKLMGMRYGIGFGCALLVGFIIYRKYHLLKGEKAKNTRKENDDQYVSDVEMAKDKKKDDSSSSSSSSSSDEE